MKMLNRLGLVLPPRECLANGQWMLEAAGRGLEMEGEAIGSNLFFLTGHEDLQVCVYTLRKA